jgi:D-alanine-D-alanine ligase
MNIRKWLKNKKIAVLYGGLSAEREISILTGKAVLRALKKLGFNAVGIDVDRDVASNLKKNKIDFAFISLHGQWGEDGTIQGMLDIMGIPYSGDGVLANAIAINKVYSKFIFDANKVPTPLWGIVDKNSGTKTKMSFPVVIKPSNQGSAIGISIAKNPKEMAAGLREAFKYDSEILIEKYIPGTEVTVGILGGKVLPVIEIVPQGHFYDFKSKYEPGCSKHIIPPRLPEKVIEKVKETALAAFKAVGCKVLGRVDLIIDRSGKPWVLEINTIPGMTETSLLPDAAREAGLDFNALVLKILECSYLKYSN